MVDSALMRPSALAAALALVALALAPGADANAGGTPGPLRSGGAAYGAPLPVPDAHPIAQRLAPTPREITAGDPSPQIRVRVRQRGVTRVRARLVVLRMPGNRPAARISLGWLKTGQGTTVPLPATLKLQTGRYLVRLHVKDPRGNALARSATYPGRARIIVRHRKPAPAVAPAPAVLAPEPAIVPAPAPPARAGAGGRHPAGRRSSRSPERLTSAERTRASARVARATSTRARTSSPPSGTPVVAPYAGLISRTSYQAGGAGEYVVLDAIDGREYFFAHCLRGSTVVVAGAAVAAGQALCQVGATGATDGGAHLHFEIWQVGWRIPGGVPIDPLPELLTWAGG